MTAPLNERVVRALLTVAMGYDNRQSGALQIAAWMEAAARGRWTFDEAREAIHEHYSESREFVMPADVTARVKAARRQPPPVAERLALPAGPVPDQQRRDELIAAMERSLGKAVADRDALRVRCPHCTAGPGYRCYNPATGQRLKQSTVHAARTATAAPDEPAEQDSA